MYLVNIDYIKIWTLVLASAFAFSLTVMAQKPYLEEYFVVSNDARIEVETSGGSIKVFGMDRDDIQVAIFVTYRGRNIAPEKADLNNWKININKSGNTIYAKAKKRRLSKWKKNDYSISFVVYAPIDVRIDAKTSGSNLELTNLEGNQNASTSGGNIVANKIGGNIVLETSGGSITIQEIEGSINAYTSGGRIRATDVTGGILAETSGGSITLINIHGNVEARTSGGSINAEIVKPNDYIDLKTSGGSINVTVPEHAGYDINLDGNRVRANLDNFEGDRKIDKVKGKLGGGGIRLTAKTIGGSVTIRYL